MNEAKISRRGVVRAADRAQEAFKQIAELHEDYTRRLNSTVYTLNKQIAGLQHDIGELQKKLDERTTRQALWRRLLLGYFGV